MDRIKAFFHKKTVTNAGWMIGGRIAQTLINFVVNILAVRYLQPDNYGLISYAGAYTAFFMSLCTLGINSVIVKEFVNRPGEEGTIIGTALGLRAVSSFLSALMILAIVMVVDRGEQLTIAVVALCTIGLLFQILETFKYWFQSRLQSKVTTIAGFIAFTITAAYKLYLIVAGKSVVFFAIATSIDYVLVGVFLYLAYRRHRGGRLHFSLPYARELLSSSVHYILPALMISVYGQTDKLMLKQMLSKADVGFYGTAVSLCTAWCFVLSAIVDSLTPEIMEAHRDGDKNKYQRMNLLLYAIIFYISIAVSGFFTVFARFVVVLLYGKSYLPAAAPLQVITWYTAFSYLGVARNAWIVCENKQKYLIWIYLSAAIANVILNLILIPVWGTVGAAIASLAAQIVTTMVTPFFIRPLRPNAVMMVEAILLKGVRTSHGQLSE